MVSGRAGHPVDVVRPALKVALMTCPAGSASAVEASLGGLLILAGVHGGDAFLPTLTYRLPPHSAPPSPGRPTRHPAWSSRVSASAGGASSIRRRRRPRSPQRRPDR